MKAEYPHSCCQKCCEWFTSLSDDMIKLPKKTGFFSPSISPSWRVLTHPRRHRLPLKKKWDNLKTQLFSLLSWERKDPPIKNGRSSLGQAIKPLSTLLLLWSFPWMWWPHDSYYRIRETLFREKLLTASPCDGGKKGNTSQSWPLRSGLMARRMVVTPTEQGKGEGGSVRERCSVWEEKYTHKKHSGL